MAETLTMAITGHGIIIMNFTMTKAGTWATMIMTMTEGLITAGITEAIMTMGITDIMAMTEITVITIIIVTAEQ